MYISVADSSIYLEFCLLTLWTYMYVYMYLYMYLVCSFQQFLLLYFGFFEQIWLMTCVILSFFYDLFEWSDFIDMGTSKQDLIWAPDFSTLNDSPQFKYLNICALYWCQRIISPSTIIYLFATWADQVSQIVDGKLTFIKLISWHKLVHHACIWENGSFRWVIISWDKYNMPVWG